MNSLPFADDTAQPRFHCWLAWPVQVRFLQATTLSIPAIAASVGIPDLQAFNKACRRELGASPRGIRKGLN